MRRRALLAAVGTSLGVAGCQGLDRTGTTRETGTDESRTDPTPTDTASRTDTASPTDTDRDWQKGTDEPTETPRCLGQTDQRLPIGASVRYNDWEFTVTSVELTRTYQLDGESKTRTLPDGKQFVIVTVDAVNHAEERRLWTFDSGFRLIGPGCTTIFWDSDFPTDEMPEIGVSASRIQRIEHIKQFQRQVYYPFDPGQQGRMWYPAVTKASYDRSELEIGSDFTPRRPPTRWVPKLTTETDS